MSLSNGGGPARSPLYEYFSVGSPEADHHNNNIVFHTQWSFHCVLLLTMRNNSLDNVGSVKGRKHGGRRDGVVVMNLLVLAI